MALSTDVLKTIQNVIVADLKRTEPVPGSPSSSRSASRIEAFLTLPLAGGWEAWLQVESALGLVGANIASAFNREQPFPPPSKWPVGAPFPGAAQRCDLVLTAKTGGVPIFVELKTQRGSAYANTMADLLADVAKLKALGPDWNGQFVAVAVAVLRLDAGSANDLSTNRSRYAGMGFYAYPSGGGSSNVMDKFEIGAFDYRTKPKNIVVAAWTNSP